VQVGKRVERRGGCGRRRSRLFLDTAADEQEQAREQNQAGAHAARWYSVGGSGVFAYALPQFP